MTSSIDKTIPINKRSRKPERTLLIGVLLMQILIFAAIIYSRNPAVKTKKQMNCQNLISIDSTAKTQTPTNQIISPFSVMDHEMAHFMNVIFKNKRNLQRNSQQQRILKTMNKAMQDMAFFSDLMNIDRGWDMINISPAMDMREKKNSYEINFSIPDGTASNVTIELNGQLLNMYIPIHISKPGYNEFRTYKQQILIPGPINTNKEIKASISNNVLRVILPKASNGS